MSIYECDVLPVIEIEVKAFKHDGAVLGLVKLEYLGRDY